MTIASKQVNNVEQQKWQGLKFIALQNGCTVSLGADEAYGKAPDVNLMFSLNEGRSWQQYENRSALPLNNLGDSVCFMAGPTGNPTMSLGAHRSCNFNLSGKVAATGDIRSLLQSNFRDVHSFPDNCFYGLFASQNTLTTTPDICAQSCGSNSLRQMFYQCTELREASIFINSFGSYSCYQMFAGCSNLASIKLSYDGPLISPSKTFVYWVDYVSPHGEFFYNGSEQQRGPDAIPDGWHVIRFDTNEN